MSKELLHDLIDMVPESDTDVIYRVLVKFIPSDVPTPDEIEAIISANKSIEKDGVVGLHDIDWN